MDSNKSENEVNIQEWSELDIKEDLLRGIYSYGFEKPSMIQQKAIHPIINNKDVIAQAQSGTGKTGAFAVSTLQIINESINEIQAVIITPTRELVLQTENVMEKIGSFMKNLKIKTFIGGTNVNDDITYLRRNTPQVVIGTPGRFIDMLKRRHLNLHTCKLFILDEADEMLAEGFKSQIQFIFKFFNEKIQIAVFSATLPNEILSITDQFMIDPVRITMKPKELSLDGIEQMFVATFDDENKYDWLKNLFNKLALSSTVIFVNDIQKLDILYDKMKNDNFSVCKIHSSLSKMDREQTLNDFRKNKHNILLSTNLTARGIDIQQVSIVINYDIPDDVNTYLHRIGRSGRWGRKGTAINFVRQEDAYRMRNIERHYNIEIKEFS
jgi:superfamily II DNA/RNA helicase